MRGFEVVRSPAPTGVTADDMQNISVPARRVNEIVHGTRAISADTALRLARYFGTSDRFWLNLLHETGRARAGPRRIGAVDSIDDDLIKTGRGSSRARMLPTRSSTAI